MHLKGGAGIAGIIKSILILESGIIPANVNFEKVNPNIPKDQWNIDFPTECMPWPEQGPRRVSVNSFGFGGTNSHCILDDAYHFLEGENTLGVHNTRVLVPTKHEIRQLVESPGKIYDGQFYTNGDTPHTNGGKPYTNGLGSYTNGNTSYSNGDLTHSNSGLVGHTIPRVFVLSAFDKEGLERVASELKNYLEPRRSLPRNIADSLLCDLAYTLSEKRSRFRYRSYVLASSIPELEENLSTDKSLSNPISTRNSPRIGFVFTGQGAQYHGMGKQLLIYPTFRTSLEEATAYMKTLGSEWSLISTCSTLLRACMTWLTVT